jgi:hypothetical protein
MFLDVPLRVAGCRNVSTLLTSASWCVSGDVPNMLVHRNGDGQWAWSTDRSLWLVLVSWEQGSQNWYKPAGFHENRKNLRFSPDCFFRTTIPTSVGKMVLGRFLWFTHGFLTKPVCLFLWTLSTHGFHCQQHVINNSCIFTHCYVFSFSKKAWINLAVSIYEDQNK